MANSNQRVREEANDPTEPEVSLGSLVQIQDPETLEDEHIVLQDLINHEKRCKGNQLAFRKNSPVLLDSVRKDDFQASQETIFSRKSGGELCRICHDAASSERFISPCLCKGSLSQVHKSCLERWLAESDTSECELCGFKYKIARFPRYSVFMSVFAWLTSQGTWRDRRSLLVDVIALLIISPIVCFSTIMALQLMDALFIAEAERTKLTPSESSFSAVVNPKRTLDRLGNMMSKIGQMGVISMILTMDMAFVSWLAMRLQVHVTSWYSWYRRNCKVSLIDFPGGSSIQRHTSAVDIAAPSSSSEKNNEERSNLSHDKNHPGPST